jgi:hypothetical protein
VLRRVPLLASAVLLLSIAAPSVPGARAAFAPDTLSDSTWVARWTLANGLDVTVRHVPGTATVATILAWRVGRDHDPKGRDGMADLATEAIFTGATRLSPERARRQMETIRTLGWNLQVTPSYSLISEIASRDKFPVVLRELAARLAGVTVTDSLLAGARRTAVSELAQKYLVAHDLVLYNRMRDVALDVPDDAVLQRVSGRSLAAVRPAELRDRLQRMYVPANAVLAIAGDVSDVDVPRLVAGLFESIPGGAKAPPLPPVTLRATKRAIERTQLNEAIGAAGVIAPAITDSLSPDFYLNTLAIGQFCQDQWGSPGRLPTRFKYSILADPQIVHLFPPVDPKENDPDQVGVALQDAVERMRGVVMQETSWEEIRVNHQWILGGPIMPGLRYRMRIHAGTLFTLANTMAVQALWGDQAFWDRYLARFLSPGAIRGYVWWEYFQNPDKIVRLLLVPAAR